RGICNLHLLKSNSLASPKYSGIGVLSLFWIEKTLKGSINASGIPVRHEREGVDGGNSIFITSDYILNQISLYPHSGGLFFCQHASFNRTNGERECTGHLIRNDFSHPAYGHFRTRITVNLFNPEWEIIVLSSAVVRLPRLSVNIGHDQTVLQEEYLDRCPGRNSLTVGSYNHAVGRYSIDNGGGTGTAERAGKNEKRD